VLTWWAVRQIRAALASHWELANDVPVAEREGAFASTGE